MTFLFPQLSKIRYLDIQRFNNLDKNLYLFIIKVLKSLGKGTQEPAWHKIYLLLLSFHDFVSVLWLSCIQWVLGGVSICISTTIYHSMFRKICCQILIRLKPKLNSDCNYFLDYFHISKNIAPLLNSKFRNSCDYGTVLLLSQCAPTAWNNFTSFTFKRVKCIKKLLANKHTLLKLPLELKNNAGTNITSTFTSGKISLKHFNFFIHHSNYFTYWKTFEQS